MRRFITTLTGKVIGQVAVAALLLPTLTLCLATRANAQLARRASWAVIPFSVNGKASPNGAIAAKAVYDEISKRAESFRPPIEVIPPEQVARTEETLGLTDPITDQTSVLRLGQELGAQRIVLGDIVDSKIVGVGGNRQANVLVQVIVRDVASGIDINGSSVQAFSTVRAGNTPDETLITEALNIAANKAIGAIQMQSLPTGTVLNTQPTTALVNQGSRSGFKVGQQVIITRGRDEVATGHVFDVDFDSSNVRVDRSFKGMAPGDKVSVIFTPQRFINIGPGGQARIERSRNHGNNSGIISAVLLLGLAAILLGGSGNNGQSAANEVTAEATTTPGAPANKVTWSTQGFFRYTGVSVRWQIYRGVESVPIGNVDGAGAHAYFDTNTPRAIAYYPFPPGSSTGTACAGLPGETAITANGVTVGRQFTYRVELVFRVSSLDLPGGGSSTSGTSGGTTSTTGGGTTSTTGGGTTSTTGGGTTSTTGGGTTSTTGGGTTSGGGGGGGGGTDCFFISSQTTSRGGATAINPPQLNLPAEGATVTSSQLFTFQSVINLDSFVAQYVLQVSKSPNFTKGSGTVTYPFLLSPATGTLSITASPASSFSNYTGTLWWRVGARNSADRPGPVPDPTTKLRYVFSSIRSFKLPTPPPPPPGGL